MLGRDKLTVGLWLTAGIAAVAVILLGGEPGRVAGVAGVAALVACSRRRRCLEHRRARRQRRSDAGVMSSADYVREQARSSAQRIAELRQQVDQQGKQIRAVYSYLGRSGDPRAPAEDAEQTGPLPKLGLVKDEAS